MLHSTFKFSCLSISLVLAASCVEHGSDAQPVDDPEPTGNTTPAETLEERVPPPDGYARVPAAEGSFTAWLRRLPLRAGRGEVRLFDGRLKANQRAHHAVINLDIGTRNLQQCADAVIRMRAEYLFSLPCDADIAFHFTSGDLARWREWRQGMRPRVAGDRVSWVRSAAPDDSHANFRRYLDSVFTYAGTLSLSREMLAVDDPRQIQAGDVLVQGGSPGHAVLVVDVAANDAGSRVFLLAQSYMPAQDIELLRNPANPGSPWYEARETGRLETPEWTFGYGDLCRFAEVHCVGH